MARLPISGGDNGRWGDILNDFLKVEHNEDGTLNPNGSLKSMEPRINNGKESQYFRGDKTWQVLDTTAVSEGSNLYYTDERARSVPLNEMAPPTDEVDFNNQKISNTAYPILASDIVNKYYVDSLSYPQRVIEAGIFHTTDTPGVSVISEVQELDTELGIKHDWVSAYRSINEANFEEDLRPILDAGYKAQYFIMMRAGETSANLDVIISHLLAESGDYYDWLIGIFEDILDDGRDDQIMLIPFPECNSDWSVYAAFYTGNSPEKLKQAFQLVSQLVRNSGLRCSICQLYNVTNPGIRTNLFSEMFAGDEYVDYVGIDDYNRMGLSYNNWQYPGANLRQAYNQIINMSAKPIIIGENNSIASTGSYSRPQWIVDYARMIASGEFSRIQIHTIFSKDATNVGSGNWYLSTQAEKDALATRLRLFKGRARINDARSNRPINVNLLPHPVTNSTTNWGKIGSGSTIDTSTDVPDWIDSNELCIKFTKPTSEGTNTHDYYFHYIPQDYSWWIQYKTYTISFYAKASEDNVRLGVGLKENGGIYNEEVDNTIVIGAMWKRYQTTMAPSFTSVNGIRSPWFNVGLNSNALEIYIAGIKIENGHQITPLIPSRSIYGSTRKRVFLLTDGPMVSPNADLADIFKVILGDDRSIANPSGTPVDGQRIQFRIKQDITGNRAISWDSKYRFTGGIAPNLSTTGDATDYFDFQYNTDDNVWDNIAYMQGL